MMQVATDIELQALNSPEGPAETEEVANNEDIESAPLEDSSQAIAEDNANDATLIVIKHRPTLASIGEPSHNIPKKHSISISFVFAIIICICIAIGFLSSIAFTKVLFRNGIENMLHWIEDKSNNPLLNFVIIFFTTFDIIIFCISANANVMLATICGYLYSWPIGSAIYIVFFAISNATVFIIGQTLLRDRMYTKINGNERYRYAYRVLSDQAMVFGISLFLCPFIPAGVISYILSLTRITWTQYMIALSAVIPSTVLLTYAASLVSTAEDIPDAYMMNDIIYGSLVLLCVIGVLLFVFVLIRLYMHYARSKALPDAEKKEEEVIDEKEEGESIEKEEKEKEIVESRSSEGDHETQSEIQTTESVDIASVDNSESHGSWDLFNKEEVSESSSAVKQSKHLDLVWLKFETQGITNEDEMIFLEDETKAHKKRVEVMK